MAKIISGDPRDPRAEALLRQHHALMQSLFPAEANHFLSVDALCAPEIRFFVAEEEGRLLGCGALKLAEGYGEVKSMFVAPEARGLGVARALLQRIEGEARLHGLPLLQLETGDSLSAAHALYHGEGFAMCGPFGDYQAGPFSLFMSKPLA